MASQLADLKNTPGSPEQAQYTARIPYAKAFSGYEVEGQAQKLMSEEARYYHSRGAAGSRSTAAGGSMSGNRTSSAGWSLAGLALSAAMRTPRSAIAMARSSAISPTTRAAAACSASASMGSTGRVGECDAVIMHLLTEDRCGSCASACHARA